MPHPNISTRRRQEERRRTLRPHPMRDQIVDAMRSYGRPISPTQLSAVTGATLGSLAYHVRTLVSAGVVELRGERRVRGAVEHFYGLADDPEQIQLTDPVDALLVLCRAKTMPDAEGGYPRPVVVDARARKVLLRMISALEKDVQDVVADSTRRGSP